MSIDISSYLSSNNLIDDEETIGHLISSYKDFYSKQMEFDQISCLINFVFSIESSHEIIELLLEKIRLHDQDFPKSPTNYYLKRIVLGALLFKINSSEEDIGLLIAMALSCCYCFGLRTGPIRMNMNDLCNKIITDFSRSNRMIQSIPLLEISKLTKSPFAKVITEPELFNNPEYLTEVDREWNNIVNRYNSLSEKVNQSIVITNKNMQVEFEEKNILWWIIQRSMTLVNGNSQIPKIIDSIVEISLELSTIIHFLPGPIAINELIAIAISKVCDVTGKISLESFLDNISDKSLLLLKNDDSFTPTCITPIYFLCDHKIFSESRSKKSLNNERINLKHSFTYKQLATQIFQESVFNKSISNHK